MKRAGGIALLILGWYAVVVGAMVLGALAALLFHLDEFGNTGAVVLRTTAVAVVAFLLA